MKLGAPCYIFCRNIDPDYDIIKIATRMNVPILKTKENTTTFMYLIIKYLNEKLSPSICLHGCLVDIFGIGVFIRGESGIGKSEAVLELIKRGHRMIADDVVDIHISENNKLLGKAPTLTKDYLEIRGIGLVNIKNMFGVQAIKESQSIEMVAVLEEWDSKADYNRLGNNIDYSEILGHKILNYRFPLRPGRNLAVILEAAALSCRSKMMAYYDTEEFIARIEREQKFVID